MIPLLVAFFLLASVAPIPAVRASTEGPYGLYVETRVSGYTPLNAYQAYPGGTVYFDYEFVNSQGAGSLTITKIQLTTPWETYSDPNMPESIDQGVGYYSYFTITIPSDANPGNVTWTLDASVSGYQAITSQYTFTIYLNPTTLESQISGLNSQVTSLQGQVSSLQSQLTTAETNETNLQGKVSSLQGQVSGLQTELTAAQTNATNLQTSVESLKSQLSTSQSQLSTTQTQLTNVTARVGTLTTQIQTDQSEIANKTSQIGTLTSQLSSTQASLTTANSNLAFAQGEVATDTSFYLPVGVAVPSLVAVLFIVLYLRKGSRPSAVTGMPPAQATPPPAAPAPAVSTSRFCSECGAENRTNAKFCGKCGASLS